jgi:hypothetical protein
MADLALTILWILTGAIAGHLAYGSRYKQALRRIIDASNRPRSEGLGAALNDADELLGRPGRRR